MVVGGGQVAKAFSSYSEDSGVVIFASGVSDSNEVQKSEFGREKSLLTYHLKNSQDKKFVYFSSCAVIDDARKDSPYYEHKLAMEGLVEKYSTNRYIFRMPQLFGQLIRHTTLINYLYYKILDGEKFDIYDEALRYVIYIDDAVSIVSNYLLRGAGNRILDIANPYAYSIKEIVECLEIKANRSGIYNVLKGRDGVRLDLRELLAHVKKENLDFGFGKYYLHEKLGIKPR